MKNRLIEFIVDYLQRINWPKSNQVSLDRENTFRIGLDTVGAYRGNPEDLIGAINLFVSTDVLSYALAGSAVVMCSASYLSGDTYDFDGLQKAMDLIRKARQLLPNRPEIEWIEPNILICKKEYQSARMILDQLHKVHPSHTLLNEVEMYYWSKFNPTISENWFWKALESPVSDRRRINLYNSMAGNFLEGKMPDRALDLYHQIVQLDPEDPWLWHNMSIIYLNRSQFGEAYECNRRALSLMEFGAARQVGELIREQLSKSTIIEESRENLEKDPEHAEVYLWKMVDGYMNTRQFGEAIQTLTRIIKLNPKDASAYNHRGNVFSILGQLDNSISDFGMAIKLQPKSMYYYNRGNSYYDKRDFKRAIDDYSYAIKLEPANPDLYLNRGNAYKAMRQSQKAISDYSESLKIQPKSSLPHVNLGILYASLGEKARAKKEFELVLAITDDPNLRQDIKRRLELL